MIMGRRPQTAGRAKTTAWAPARRHPGMTLADWNDASQPGCRFSGSPDAAQAVLGSR